jgi:hypothetical protein
MLAPVMKPRRLLAPDRNQRKSIWPSAPYYAAMPFDAPYVSLPKEIPPKKVLILVPLPMRRLRAMPYINALVEN